MVRSFLAHPRYEPLSLLGRGSQGVLLRVRDREDPRRPLVAKVLDRGLVDDGALRLEFAVLARLNCPGIARVRDLAEDTRTGAPFLVEDLIEGETAEELVLGVPAGPARVTRVVRVLSEVAGVLAALHDAGVVHGDVKPAHLRMGETGVTLLDLGSAFAPRLGIALAGYSPAFAAPEVRRGEAATELSDGYSLGASVRHILGVRPGAKARSAVPWLAPSLAELLDDLVQEEPTSRPASALEIARRLGARAPTAAAPPPVGRARELAAILSTDGSSVRYLVGPPGSGKSHLLGEARTALLLAGTSVRLHRFPDVSPLLTEGLAMRLASEDDGGVLLLDDLDRAPRLIREQVHARNGSRTALRIVAVVGDPPGRAEIIALGELSAAELRLLAHRVGARNDAEAGTMVRQAEGRPGWLVAAAGRVPLSWAAVAERTSALPVAARKGLFAVARAGGSLSLFAYDRVSPPASRRALVGRGLLQVRGGAVELCSPALASTLAAALRDVEVEDLLADALMASDVDSPAACLAAAEMAGPRGRSLLHRAVDLAARVGDVDTEISAGLSLAAHPEELTAALLARLERRTRDSDATRRAQVLALVEAASRTDPRLVPLAKRRRADEAAKAGSGSLARALSAEATQAARSLGDLHEEALCLATEGAVALLAADWPTAEARLEEAEQKLRGREGDDADELARLSHNRGAVALYRERIPAAVAAFEDALSRKRALGDRAGVRSCLSNLALSEMRRMDFARADKLLDEAVGMARGLRQTTGLAWCLGVRAEAALRRGRFAEAVDHADEALAIEGIPGVLSADLALHRADALTGLGRYDEATSAVESVPPALGDADPWLAARCELTRLRLALARAPDRRRDVARRCLAAVRGARASGLPDIEAEARALLRAARDARDARSAMLVRVSGAWGKPDDEALDALLSAAAHGTVGDGLARLLLLPLLSLSAAERAFFVHRAGSVSVVHGFDVDGLALSEARARLDDAFVGRLLARGGVLRETLTAPGAPGADGSRAGVGLQVEGGGVALVLEHRFQSRCFDDLDPVRLARWCLAAGVVARLSASSPTLSGRSPDGPAPSPPPRVGATERAAVVPLVEAPGVARLPEPEEATVVPARRRRTFPELVGQSEAFVAALTHLTAALESDLPVLLTGETGTGKELFAKALHDHGKRSRGPFVPVNCAAIPDALFEGELFGHARGSFTGADRLRPGLIVKAEGGLLFLDEVGELPLARQATLLRVIETRKVRPVGADDERPFDVRIVAATNRDLDAAVAEGAFRADLLYRLRVIALTIPPLRQRAGDARLLFAHYAAGLGAPLELTAGAALLVESYGFPGNVRELRHLVERLAASGLSRVDVPHLPRALRATRAEPVRAPEDPREEIERILAERGGNLTHAATALGLTRHGLKKRMVRLGLRAPKENP